MATIYAYDKAKAGLVPPRRSIPTISKMPGLPSGGGGLYGTAADYFRFAQMLLNGGEYDGKRILKKATVDMMRTNVLSDEALNSNSGIGQARFSPAQGFGYDFAVVLDPDAAKRQVGKGSYWWWGIGGTWFWIDPTNDLVGGRHHPAPRRCPGRRQSRRHFAPGDRRGVSQVGADLVRAVS